MGQLKDFEIPHSLILKVHHEMLQVEEGEDQLQIAEILIQDEVYDASTRDYLLGFVQDTAAAEGTGEILSRLYHQILA